MADSRMRVTQVVKMGPLSLCWISFDCIEITDVGGDRVTIPKTPEALRRLHKETGECIEQIERDEEKKVLARKEVREATAKQEAAILKDYADSE